MIKTLQTPLLLLSITLSFTSIHGSQRTICGNGAPQKTSQETQLKQQFQAIANRMKVDPVYKKHLLKFLNVTFSNILTAVHLPLAVQKDCTSVGAQNSLGDFRWDRKEIIIDQALKNTRSQFLEDMRYISSKELSEAECEYIMVIMKRELMGEKTHIKNCIDILQSVASRD